MNRPPKKNHVRTASHRRPGTQRRRGLTHVELLESRLPLTSATLSIFVAAQQIQIPEDIGVSLDGDFLSQIRTISTNGDLDINPIDQEPLADVTLGDFFDTWRNNAGAAGNNPAATFDSTQLLENVVDDENSIQMFVNGQPSDELENYVIQEADQIVLAYTSNPVISLNTNFGPIVVELFETETPVTVDNFLEYANDGSYIDSFFHRSATSPAVIQGGGFETSSASFTSIDQFSSIPTRPAIVNEPKISNLRGTIAMAKTSLPDSATNQFFVNLDDVNAFLDNPDVPSNTGGFTVFGQVLDMRTADAISELPVETSNPAPYGQLPVAADGTLAVIQSVAGLGTITGRKFVDQNANGNLDVGEQEIAGATIFIDANENGVFDAEERAVTTDADGRYRLQIAPGSYRLATIVPPGFELTSPAGQTYSVDVEIGRDVSDRDFGEVATQLIANDDSFEVTNLGGHGLEVLANDAAPSGTLIVAVTQGTQGGAVSIDGEQIEYTAEAEFTGIDTFTYTISDTDGETATATVSVNVTASVGMVSGIVFLDRDGNGFQGGDEPGVPGSLITISGVGFEAQTITGNDGSYRFDEVPAGSYTITQTQPAAMNDPEDDDGENPNPNQLPEIVVTGGDENSGNNFTDRSLKDEFVSIVWFFASSSPSSIFRDMIALAEDNAGNSALASDIRSAVESPTEDTGVPTAVQTNSTLTSNADLFSVEQGSVLNVDASEGVLANDIDADGDILTAELTSPTANGQLTLSPDGSFRYVPDDQFLGTDTFIYRSTDGRGTSNVATVSINVTEDNEFVVSAGAVAGTSVGTVVPESLDGQVIYQFENPGVEPDLLLNADDHLSGDPTASTVLVEYLDFQCPFCAAVHPVVENLEDEFEGDLLVVRRHLPLESVHPNARAAARAAEAAAAQGMFVEMGDLLFERRLDWVDEVSPEPILEGYATELGLDVERFRRDQSDPAVDARITRDQTIAFNTLGVTGTPTFYLNSEFIETPTDEDFPDVIQEAIDSVERIFEINRLTGELVVADAELLAMTDATTFPLSIWVTDLEDHTETIDVVVRRMETTSGGVASALAADVAFAGKANWLSR